MLRRRVYVGIGGDFIEQNFLLIPIQVQMAAAMQELDACNELSGHFGLALTGEQML